jgi:hypothetical protein
MDLDPTPDIDDSRDGVAQTSPCSSWMLRGEITIHFDLDTASYHFPESHSTLLMTNYHPNSTTLA